MNRRVFMVGAGMVGMSTIFSCSPIGANTIDGEGSNREIISRADTLDALRPPKRTRPLVAILADNTGSETTDLIVPWSILKRSDVADVVIVSTGPGDVELMPALKIVPDMMAEQFDALHDAGADYVIVPAFHNPKNPIAATWLKQQSAKGATVAGICSGALVLAHAGLLVDRRATTHWFDRKKLLRISPTTTLQLNNRYLADRGVATSTGVSASLPFAMTLVEAISGRPRADRIAADIGLRDFGQEHDSDGFRLQTHNVFRLAANFVSQRDQFGLQIDGDTDELVLAFSADAWSRTYRSSVATFSDEDAGIVSALDGLRIIPDTSFDEGAKLLRIQMHDGLPAKALDDTLDKIAARYGLQTANLVALQLEYQWNGT